MSDPMQMPQGGMPQGQGAPKPTLAGLSALDPKQAALMGSSGNFSPNTTIRELYAKFGIDVDGPITQLQKFAQDQIQNKTSLGKMPQTALQPGGRPPTMPGRKPMVQPPGQPSPAGLEGLMNRLG